MTCRVTTYTYSRPLRALNAFVRDRKTYGQYHASATRKMPGTKYQLVVVALSLHTSLEIGDAHAVAH